MSYKTVNPYTNELVKEFPANTDVEIQTALSNAQTAFGEWKKTSFPHRSSVLHKAATILREQKDEYAKLLTIEMGKLYVEAKLEVGLCADIFDYFATYAEAHLEPRKIKSGDKNEGDAFIFYEPQGIILAVEPWNFPFYQITRIIAPQLSAGNVVLLKHASNVPQSAAIFQKLMIEAGLPPGAFTTLFPTRDQVSTIIHDPRVRGVALTGSEGAGSVVSAQAGHALIKTTMELGGSDAFVVLKDADLDKAVKWAVFGRHWNAGQVCVSSKRLIIADEIYDEFLQKYLDGVNQFVAGDPFDNKTTLAPLSSASAVKDITEQVKKAKELGVTAIESTVEIPSQGCFFKPVTLVDIPADSPARHWEFFGPVGMVFRFKTEEEAIKIANDSPYGLGGSIFSKDIERATKLAREIDTGMVFINHPTMVKADLPFGGVKRSGHGRELLDLGIHEFVNAKLVGIVDIDAPF